jgi:hypothetical protein
LTVCLELGIPDELAWLGAIAGRSLDRGDYLRLHRAKIATREAVLNASCEDLAKLIGNPLKISAIEVARRRIADEAAKAKVMENLPMPRIQSAPSPD